MKRVIELGNNVKVERSDEGFKIISSCGSEILLDSRGEFLSYTNEVGLKQLRERKEFLDKFVKLESLKRMAIVNWINEYPKENVKSQKANFFFWLGQAMAEVEYDYYIAEITDCSERIGLLNGYQNIVPEYELERATKNEEIIWIAYNIAKGYWTFEEGLTYNRRKNKTLYVLKK